jgi:hypothetical protein
MINDANLIDNHVDKVDIDHILNTVIDIFIRKKVKYI